MPNDPADDPILAAEAGERAFLLGNEAIARGALEAGVAFACGYPGTPSTEISETLARVAAVRGFAFQWSVNEKIALESAFGACLSGARALVAMKHLGLGYAGDPIATIPYVGTAAGLVVVSAADPSCRTSPNEQDQRHLADMLHLPTLEPSSAQEALEMTRFAFELSESSRLPVLMRPTTRLCHTRAPVTVGALTEANVSGFQRDPRRYVPIPVNARRMREEIVDRLERARQALADSPFMRRSGSGRTGVLSAGVPAAICRDLLRQHQLQDRVVMISLGAAYPLPEAWLAEQLEGVDTLLVIEELTPFLEDALRAWCALRQLPVRVLGKRTDHVPGPFELDRTLVRRALADGLGLPVAPPATPAPVEDIDSDPAPPRPPVLCAGCPHRSSFFAARAAFGDDTLFFNDIGCYTLGYGPPLDSADALLSMGSGFPMAAAAARATGKRTVGFMGDGTFFHSGLPALLDAAKDDANVVAVIMDNAVTAMTGFQESPVNRVENGSLRKRVDVVDVCRSLGVKQVQRVDPHDLEATITAFRRAAAGTGTHVIVTERACPVFALKANLAQPAPPFDVDAERCARCGRDAVGHRCAVPTTEGYQRALSRARSLESDTAGARRPEVAPCASACPLFLCIQGYVGHVAAGEHAHALAHILERLPLPESVCRVCHRPCETACVRAPYDEPVAINDLKRFVVEWANAQPEPFPRPDLEPDNGLRVAVVGAGPCGLAAAHELRVRGYDVTLYDADDEPGGMLRSGVPRYRLPEEALRRDVRRILEIGVRFKGGRRLGKDLSLQALIAEFDAVFLAVGGGPALPLQLPAADGGGPATVGALEFLQTHRDGAGGAALQGAVLVLGGGNAAIDAARTALRCGATEVRIACLESRDRMPAIALEIHEAETEGIRIQNGLRAVRFLPDGVEMVGVAPKVPEPRVPDDWEDVASLSHFVRVSTVIVAFGQGGSRGLFGEGVPGLELSPGGVPAVDTETFATSIPQLFAGGDYASAPGSERTVTGAIATGLRAAWGIDRSLRGSGLADRRSPPPIPEPVFRAPRIPGKPPFPRAALVPAPVLPVAARAESFAEVARSYDEAAARDEAMRCLMCGACGNCRSCVTLFGCPAFVPGQLAVDIDPALCTGCAVCADFCPDGAILSQSIMAPRSRGDT